VFLAGMERAKETAQERIAFQKTWLFSEGLGDNLWVPAEDAVESSSRT
ncbi:MAG: hypothetical protein HY248_03655, partial [Fimbriimonas ginsengisoli]|nr:hypothetical protein [Fimbriimonas ginsengisoli]